MVEIKDINVKKSAKMERISGSIWIDHKKLADFHNNIKKQYGFRLVEGANSEMYNGFLEILNASLPDQPDQFTHYIHEVVNTYRDLERTINHGSLKAPSDQNLLLIQTDAAPLQKFPLPYPLWAIQATDLGISYLQAYFSEKVIPKISKAKEIDTFGVPAELTDILFNTTIGKRRLAASVFIQMMKKEAEGRHPFKPLPAPKKGKHKRKGL